MSRVWWRTDITVFFTSCKTFLSKKRTNKHSKNEQLNPPEWKSHFSWVDAGLNLICGFERVIFIFRNQKKKLSNAALVEQACRVNV